MNEPDGGGANLNAIAASGVALLVICILPAKGGAEGNSSFTNLDACWLPAKTWGAGEPMGFPLEPTNCNVIVAADELGLAYATAVRKPDCVSTKIACFPKAAAEGTPASPIREPLVANSENTAVPLSAALADTDA